MKVLSKITPFTDVVFAFIIGAFGYYQTRSVLVGIVAVPAMIFAPSILVRLYKVVFEGIRHGRNRRQE